MDTPLPEWKEATKQAIAYFDETTFQHVDFSDPYDVQLKVLRDAAAEYLSQSAKIERLREAVAEVDAASGRCPVRATHWSVDECPACGATERQNCGKWVTAVAALEQAARQALGGPNV